jgi:transcriptional regulator with XRE-family HTH domain
MPKTIFGGDHHHLVQVLKAARQDAGLTQAELATRIGKDQTFVSIVERGQRRVDVIEFISLAKAMGRDPVALMRDVCQRVG